jgi:hypothetical protein
MNLYDQTHVKAILEALPRQEQGMEADIKTITDPNSKPSWVRRDLRTFRNFPVGGKLLEMVISFVKDESRPTDQRILAAEVLGWYTMYHDKASIIATLKEYKAQDAGLANEIQKSIARLEGKNR